MFYDAVIETILREGSGKRGSAVQQRAGARQGGYRAYCAACQQGWRVPYSDHGEPAPTGRTTLAPYRGRGGRLAAHRLQGGQRPARRRRRTPARGWSACSTSTTTPGRAAQRGAARAGRPGVQRAGQPVGGGDPARRRGVGRRATSTGVVVSAVRHGNARPASWTSALASHDTDGVILVTSELTTPQLRAAAQRRHPAGGGRPGEPAAAGRGQRRRDQLGRRPGRHRAPARPRPPPDRRDRRAGATTCAAGPGSTATGRRWSARASPFDPALVRHGDFQHEGGFMRGRRAARPGRTARPPSSPARPAGARRLRGRPAARAADPAGPERRRLRRPAGGPLGLARR